MDSNLIVTLPREWQDRSRLYGQQVVATYQSGGCRASLAVSSHGAEKDPALQAQAKMAECAFCIWGGLDPAVLKWNAGRCDRGYDLIWRGLRVDVKRTTKFGSYMIWPINKRFFFGAAEFDILLLARGANASWEINGWISKAIFAREHETAGPGHRLNAGPWCMHERNLWPMFVQMYRQGGRA
jgi:hypothetical protein